MARDGSELKGSAGFDRSRILRPRATRKGSSERYLLARSLQAGTG